jgi:pyruvate/2-oxoglutarate dehydrogenase complex dihydrolipoamide dehydrogenase (E3) component
LSYQLPDLPGIVVLRFVGAAVASKAGVSMSAGDEIFDVIVIGAGPVGMTAAMRAARGGLSTAVVERRLAGGECQYYGCVPSKAMLLPLELADEVSRMPGLAMRGPIDAPRVLARRDDFVDHRDDAAEVSQINSFPAAFVRGQGQLAGPLRAEVSGPDGSVQSLRARHAVVLATGSDPHLPDLPGLREAQPWTNREATSVEQVPKRLAVIGGGPVSTEMSQALHSLGAEDTTMIVASERLLPKAEPFAGDLVAKSFQDAGIDVRLNRFVRQVERPVPAGPVTVHTDDGVQVEADELLVGTGREPVVRGIGLDTIGIEAEGPIEVDSSMRATAMPDGWLYAIGDVNGRNQLTHMGKYQARICGDAIVARAKGLPDDGPGLRDIADDKGAPQAIFTDPQVLAVGRTEAKARADGVPVRAVEYDVGAVIGAKLQADGYTGRAKAVVDEDRRTLIGFTLVGPAVVDHLHAATIAVTAEVPIERLWHAVPAFPTASEFWLGLLEAYGM